MITESFSIAFKNMKRRKLRSWLTIIGIIMSIATIFILISVSLGLSSSIQEQFRQLGTDKFFVMPKGQLGQGANNGAVTLTDTDIIAIKKVAGVKAISSFSVASVKVQLGDQTRFVMLIGVDEKSLSLFSESGFIKVDEGRLLSAGDSKSIMLGSLYKGTGFFKREVAIGTTLKINDQNYKVRTLLKSAGNPSDDKNIYALLSDFENIFPAKKNIYDELIVQVEPGLDVKAVADKVQKQLIRTRGVTEKTKDFTIQTPEELLATFSIILNVLTAFLLGVAAISLVVGGIGIMNTMYTAVVERTKEIGVMKAVGARNFDILSIFTVESGLLGLIGGIGGVVLGTIVAKTIEFIVINQFGVGMFAASTPWYLFLGSLGFSFIIGCISGIVPSYQASRIRPVIALRYE